MWLRIVLGAIYLGMAAGQLISIGDMVDILDAYQAVPRSALPVGIALLIAAEIVCGAWFLARPKSTTLTPVWIYTAASLVWAALGTQAWLRDLDVDNCGCFGSYLTQQLSPFVLAQDALLLVYAALMIRSARRARATDTSRARLPESVEA